MNALIASSSFFAATFFCSYAIFQEAFCASVRRAGAGRDSNTRLVGLRAAQEWLFDSSEFHPGVDASGDAEREGSCGDDVREGCGEGAGGL
jgi:hypothetical protein